MSREPMNIINNDIQYEALKAHQEMHVENNDTHKD